MAFAIPNTIEFGSEITSAEHEQNYTAIETEINSNVIRADGTVPMAAQLQLFANPAADNDAARKAYVDALDVGFAKPCFSASLPAGHALCNGASITRASAPLQAAALAPNASSPFWIDETNFYLPNMTDRAVIGIGGIAAAVGGTGGSRDAVVVTHNHTQNSHNHSQNSHSHTTSSNGEHGHNLGNGTVVPYFQGAPGAYGFTPGSLNWNNTGPWNGTGASATYSAANAGSHGHTVNGETATNIAVTATNIATGVVGTDKNMPPFIGCRWVLRLI